MALCIKLESENSKELATLSIYSLQGNFREIDRNLEKNSENYYIEYYYGYSYLIGRNVLIDYEKAENHLTNAAKYCFSPAHYSLGYLYTKKNKNNEAKKWFISAKILGDNLAAHQLGIIYKNEKNISNMLENFEYAANNGFTPSITELGVLYYDGILVEKNLKAAYEYFKKSALRNDALAQNNLGWMYENGEGTKKDIKQAIYWYEISSSNDFILAKKNLDRVLDSYNNPNPA